MSPPEAAPSQLWPAASPAQPGVARLASASLPETFERILESVTDAWVAMDAAWHITYANPAAERLLQRDRATLVGGRFWEDFPLAFVDAFSSPLEQAARDRTVVEVDRHAPTLYRWFEVRVYPTAVGVALCARDVTDRRRQQEALRRTETAARQNQKLEAIGRLAGGIAHDFNNLLTAIKGYSDLILADLVDARDGRIDIGHLRDDIDQIRKAADSAAGLTGQLLAFGRQQVMQPRPLDLNVYVAETEKMLRRVISEDIEMRLLLDKGAACVTADPTQIEQVLMNLVLNARDAMPEGGHLTIETGQATLDEAYAARHVGVTPGAYVVLSVSDTGHGMDAMTQARLFEPFFTTKERGKGTGLGLATAYGIVKQSGGNIWAYSEMGIGTTIKVYLPRTGTEVPPPALAAPVETSGTLHGTETVLVVEDEGSVRQLVSGVLRRWGYTVLVADDGFDALRASEGSDAPIHLLLTDVVMPGMSGRRLADRIAAQRPGIRILYMSGYTEHAIIHHGVVDLGTDFIEKPFTPDELARKVRATLDADGGHAESNGR